MLASRLRLPPFLVAALTLTVATLLYLAWQLQPAYLDTFAYSYDEGVYLQTALALQDGHELYADTFSAQPPLLPALLAGLFQVTGPSVGAARTLVAMLSLLGVAGVALATGRDAGRLAALAAAGLLAFSPAFLLGAHQVATDIPALALAALALGLGLRAGRRRPGWWLAAGTALALATTFKLSGLVVVPALVVAFVASRRRAAGWRPVARDLLLVIGPTVLLWSLILSQVDIPNAVDQLITFRTDARTVYKLDVEDNARHVLGLASRHAVMLALALVGAASLWWRRQWRPLLPLLVAVGTALVATLAHAPLFEGHLVVLLPPIAALAGVGLQAGLSGLTRWADHHGMGGASSPARFIAAVAATLCVVALVVAPAAVASARDRPRPDDGWAEAAGALAALAELPPDTAVLTDDQMLAFVAGRPVPPEFVDTSRVRISAGSLTTEAVAEAVEQGEADAVLFWSGRLRRLPDLLHRVRQHCHLEQSFGEGRELYVCPED